MENIGLDQWGSIAGVVLAVVVVGTILYQILKWKAKTDGDISRQGDCADLDRTAANNRINQVEERAKEDRTTFNVIATEIREDIKKILLYVNPNPPIESNSPYRLTEFGEKIANVVKDHIWAEQLVPELKEEIEGKEPFEIDDFAHVYVNERITDKWRRQIAICAYEMGTEKSNVEAVLAIVLRDKLLK